jgi:hypothetical protein
VLGNLGDTFEDDAANPFPGLGGRREGILLDPRRCPIPCQEAIPASSMRAARQHEITRTVAVAFFDAHLKDAVGARCFLRKGLRRETPDAKVRGG